MSNGLPTPFSFVHELHIPTQLAAAFLAFDGGITRDGLAWHLFGTNALACIFVSSE